MFVVVAFYDIIKSNMDNKKQLTEREDLDHFCKCVSNFILDFNARLIKKLPDEFLEVIGVNNLDIDTLSKLINKFQEKNSCYKDIDRTTNLILFTQVHINLYAETALLNDLKNQTKKPKMV